MTPEEAIKIITDEELYIAPYNWFETKKHREYEVSINSNNKEFIVFECSEHANPLDKKIYNNIEDALDDFIKKLLKSKNIVLDYFNYYDEKNKKISNEVYEKSIIYRKKEIESDCREWILCKNRIYKFIK